MKVLGFLGIKGSGKTTSSDVAKELSKNDGLSVYEVILARKLKSTCSEVFDLDMKYFTDQRFKEVELDNIISLSTENIIKVITAFGQDYNYDKHVRPHVGKTLHTPRTLLQYIGTDVLHPIDSLIHIKYEFFNIPIGVDVIVLSDLRFENEYEFLLEKYGPRDFVPIYVQNLIAESQASKDAHPSEREFHKFKNKSELLNNNGNLLDLKNNISSLLGKVYETGN